MKSARNVSSALVVLCGAVVLGTAAATAGQSPVVPCAQLALLQLPDTQITKAEAVAAGVVKANATDLPAHCLVQGIIEPRVGANGVKFGSGFELRLPVDWNVRFYFQGGGGTDGATIPAYGDRSAPVGITPALARGYAVVTTDAGHQDNDASFGLDEKARNDWGYHSIDVVTRVAKQIVAHHYGRKPDFSYLVGCSNGGRQGMMMSQRYPEAYDGIAAGAPIFRLSASHIASAWDLQTFTAIAPKDADGKPILSKAYSDADLKLVAGAMLATCDKSDGLEDGMITNPPACTFDPARLTCSGPKTDQCLTAEQVNGLKRFQSGPTDKAGAPLYTSWPWDPGIASANWRAWKLGTSMTPVPNAIKAGLSNNGIRHLMITPPDPTFNSMYFDFDKDPARMRPAAAFADATSTDLARYKARGGKLILYHGMSDAAISANDTVGYYEDLVRADGGLTETQKYARLFLVPGMGHCSAGSGLDSFDVLAALVAWTEAKTAPERIVAKGAFFPGRTRPLCPYPLHPRFVGIGSSEDADQFECQAARP